MKPMTHFVLPRGPALNLEHSLFCGQAFRWRRIGAGEFTGVVDGSVVRITREAGTDDPHPDSIHVDSSGPFDPLLYFGLDHDLDSVHRGLSPDPVLAPLLVRFPGLRLLRQDPFETLITFILSQASGIRRIAGTVERLSSELGERIEGSEEAFHSFPTPGALARVRESTLRGMGVGYRAPYLVAAARAVASGELDLGALRGGTRNAPVTEEAASRLMSLPGVGRKVADCVLLFSLDRTEAFPVDRWIERAVSTGYIGGRSISHAVIRRWAADRFGCHAGYAQQYLFHGIRSGAGCFRSPP